MKTYKFYWRDGDTDTLTGDTPEDALNNAWLGAFAQDQLDWFEEVR